MVATAAVLVVLGLAVFAGLLNLLSPYANHFKPDAERWLSQRLGQPVLLDRLQAQWQMRGPRLIVEGLRIGAGPAEEDGELYVGAAHFGVDLLHWLDPRRRGVSYFQLVGEDIELTRDQQGSWKLTGLGGDRGGGSGLSWLLKQSSISLQARNFTLHDEISDRALQVSDVRLSFNNLQDRFVVSGRAGQAEIGELAFALELDWAQSSESWQSARVWLQGKKLALPTWLGGLRLLDAQLVEGQADVELRAWVDPDGASRVLGDVELADVVVASEHPFVLSDGKTVAPRYAVDRVKTGVDFARLSEGWQLALDQFSLRRGDREWPVGDLAMASHNQAYQVSADFLRIEDIVDALLVSTAVPEATRQWLYELAPQGRVETLHVGHWQSGVPDDLSIAAQLTQLSWLPVGALPGVSGLSLELETESDGVIDLKLASSELLLDYPQRLRWPLLLESSEAELQLKLATDDWQLHAPEIVLQNDPMTITTSMLIQGGDGTAPFVDMQVMVADGLISHAKRFWPVDKFSPRLLDWLDRSLTDGDIRDGQLVLFGDLNDWPFSGNEGKFAAQANVADVQLDYHEAWPAVSEMNAQMYFDAEGIRSSVSSARIVDVTIDAASAALPSYRSPRLELHAEGSGDGPQMLDFLARSPIDMAYAEQLSVDGTGNIVLDLELPFKAGLAPRKVSGHVSLNDATISDAAWGLTFDQANGRIDYNGGGFQARDMPVQFRGYPGNLTLRSGEFVNDPSQAIEAELLGSAPASTFIPDAPMLTSVLNSVVGTPQWHASISLPRDPLQPGPDLVVRSDLRGATTKLPVPLAKPAAQIMPVELTIPVRQSRSDLTVKVAGLGELRLDQSSVATRGKLLFGEGSGSLEEGPGLVIEGKLPSVDLDGWREWLMPSMAATRSLSLDSSFVSAIDLAVDHARLSGRDFSDLSIKAAQLKDNWQITLRGDQIDGQLRVPLQVDESQLMLAEFKQLSLPKPVLPDAPDASETLPTMNPARYPPLQFVTDQLTLDGLDLGRVQIEAYPIADGMRIESFEARSPIMRITASGEWKQASSGQQSTVTATMTAEDLGELLRSFGVSGAVEGGQTLATVDAYWTGSPADFDLSRLNGDLTIDIGRGQITEVDPGAGRLIGLLSLQYLPRRLAFDFADLFRVGLTFDSLKGQFSLENGNAHTEGVRIKGPTAEIRIAGRVGLDERDYDQIVTVTPKVSGALPLIGAIAGGPVGAAAGVVLQNTLKEPLGKIAESQYTVTGSWDDPVIETTTRVDPATPQSAKDSSSTDEPLATGPSPAPDSR